MINDRMNMHICSWVCPIGALSLAFCVLLGCEKKPSSVSTPTLQNDPSKGRSTPIVTSAAAPSTKPVPAQRGPNLRHPEKGLIVTPELRDSERDRLRREFAGVGPGDPRFYETLRRLWNEIDWRALDRPVDSAGDSKVASGKLLPTELKAFFSGEAEANGAVPFAKRWDEENISRILAWLAGWSGVQGGNHLPGLLADRANQLPPTVADLVTYYAVSQGIKEMSPSTNRPYLELWKPLTEAKNPIYRLLALEAGVRAISANARSISTEDRRFNEVDGDAKVAFVQPFLSEVDPLLLARAVRVMGSLASPQAKTALERFRAAQQQAGNAEMVFAADEALRSCEYLLTTLKRDL
jgi:hypothetical protein